MAQTLRRQRQLLALYGVSAGFWDGQGRWQKAQPEAWTAVLQSLGVLTGGKNWLEKALQNRCAELLARGFDEPAVSWGGQKVLFNLWLNEASSKPPLRVAALLETGEEIPLQPTRRGQGRGVAGLRLSPWTAQGATPLPPGLHRLVIQQGRLKQTAPLIVAPRRCPALPLPPGKKGRWGLLAPVFALYDQKAPALGTYTDLAALAQGTARHGAGVLATLPLLPCFLEKPFEPSPYSPVSRLFWSDAFVDPAAAPAWPHCAAARRVLSGAAADRAAQHYRDNPLVDFAGQYALRRRALGQLADFFFSHGADAQADFQSFLKEHPGAADYALFRAVTEAQGSVWSQWPKGLSFRNLKATDARPQDAHYHLYAQYLAHRQTQALKQKARDSGVLLYLDLPLGGHAGGYDTFVHQRAYAWGVSAGAPPDAFFQEGQNWGFPPLRPDAFLGEGLAHFADCLDHHLGLADVLRLDHVMSLQRLYWVPDGLSARQGVYVASPLRALTALVCLKAAQHNAAVVGENLGTVTRRINHALVRHRLYRSYVLPFEQQDEPGQVFRKPAADMAASLNTHDMPPLRGYIENVDAVILKEAGFFDESRVKEMAAQRSGFARALSGLPGAPVAETAAAGRLLSQGLVFLSASPAPLVLVGAEDLWLGRDPQNMPGLGAGQFPSWRRRFPVDLAGLLQHPRLKSLGEMFGRHGR